MVSNDKLVVLGFPCNQFGAQEPGTNAEIKAFALDKGAKFPLFAKVDVNGDAAHPLFTKLKGEAGNKTLLSLVGGSDIKWNFGKFLISNGGAVKRYEPTTPPMALKGDIESAINRARLAK
ncbi:thioredoxin-like protein [Baffinella frigidus]|nr:thioredoxin-like protein [Cryptophyta sp. CCMP2293]|mmetsp:Transcript_27894/g.66441  ORF Transcript_27894/g.66441 Transcript_27894/m.66441 type:complete len:120 (-) Transcript_27894:302-661(-)